MTEVRLLVDVAEALEGVPWILVGGTMVDMHCQLANVPFVRPTHDVDVVILPDRSVSIDDAMQCLTNAGYVPSPSPSGTLHRFVNDKGFHVDVMIKDRHTDSLGQRRWSGLDLFRCPGSGSATGVDSLLRPKERDRISIHDGIEVEIPNIWSAIALKGHAYRTTSPNVTRHLQDALVLFACSAKYSPRKLTNSERRAYNYLLSSGELEDMQNWDNLSEDLWNVAGLQILSIRSDSDVRLPPLIWEMCSSME